MSFKIIHNQTPKEKERRRIEYTTWLQDNGYYQDAEEVYTTLIQMRKLMDQMNELLSTITEDQSH
jgi:hypothetical protein